MLRYKSFPYLLVVLLASLGCSVGTLLVRVPTPTPIPTKTPRPTFTFTPDWTPTRMPTSTATFTSVAPTATPSPVATNTPPATDTPPPRKAVPTPPPEEPPPPPDTPTPEEPTPTPAPEFPFTVTPYIYNTGSAIETRVTAYIIEVIDPKAGAFNILYDYQVKLIDPQGNEHMSNVSGGRNNSTGPGLGDNHWFNAEVKFAPYLSGKYRASLVKGGAQLSPELEFEMESQPFQYVHLDFFSFRK